MIVDSSEHVIEGAGDHQPAIRARKKQENGEPKTDQAEEESYRRCSSKCLSPVTRDT